MVTQILEALTVHTYPENEVMADVLCLELHAMNADDERFVARTTVLMENVLHHVEEEQEWFPKVREALGRNQLQEIGQRMLDLRPTAPKTPTAPKPLKKARDAVDA
ncbi:hypothetical protein [Micromonospora sp. AKA38]|uniref:hypothetical protein n=1 Tax=Micromonospora sp. AKA38 TaxID=2733861 RepID=UPI0022CC8396|nr:hypothetical protein [Micromonospora sp. AKA38]GHJ16968.1 hypothetical protein TPA0908_49630 [Micromonospora sp. AKA38]